MSRKYGTGPAFHINTAQHLVPGILTFLNQCFQIVIAKLLQVTVSLLKTDERRGYTGMYHFTLTGFETDNSTGMSGFLLNLILGQDAIG